MGFWDVHDLDFDYLIDIVIYLYDFIHGWSDLLQSADDSDHMTHTDIYIYIYIIIYIYKYKYIYIYTYTYYSVYVL